MKKLLLLLAVAVLATSASAFTYKNGGTLGPKFNDAPVGLLQKLSAKNAVKAAVKDEITSASDLDGVYATTYENLTSRSGESGTELKTSTVITTDGDNVTIVGLTQVYDPISATFQAGDAVITIPEQTVATSSYGTVSLQELFYYEGDDTYAAGWYYNDNAYLYCTEDGIISEPGHFFVTVLNEDAGNYAGYILTWENSAYPRNFSIVPDSESDVNALFTVTYDGVYTTRSPSIYSVTVSQNEGEVTVSGDFFRLTNPSFKVVLAEDHTLSIAEGQEVSDQSDQEYGVWTFHAADYSVEDPSGISDFFVEGPILGTWDSKTLNWGSFTIDSSEGYWLGASVSGKIQFLSDEEFAGVAGVFADKKADNVWYNLLGVRLNGKPSQAGVYINNGKKILVK